MVDPATTSPPAYRLYRNAWTALDWVFPPRCGGCDASGTRWCATCQSEIVRMPGEICSVCGKNMRWRDQICQRCREFPPTYKQLRSYAVFEGPLRNALHRLKYARGYCVGRYACTAPTFILAGLELGYRHDCANTTWQETAQRKRL